MSDLDRNSAARRLHDAGIDALLLFQPENFAYAVGAPAGIATMWRRGGGVIALVPSDPGERLAAVIGDLHAETVRPLAPDVDIREHRLWIDTVDITAVTLAGRPAVDIVQEGYRRKNRGADDFPARATTYDLDAVFRLLGDVLKERNLGRGRLGVDLEFLPAADYFALVAAFPNVAFVDGSAIVRGLRAVKSPTEIDRLRRACALAEAGLVALTVGVAEGQSRAEVSALWRAGVARAARDSGVVDLSGEWDYVSVGDDPWGLGGTVVPGVIIKADVGCMIAGYSSDTARSYSFRRPAPIVREVYAALTDAFEAGLASIRPGVPLRDVFAVTAASMHEAGYRGYRRGHFGHGLGASVGSEEWPFIGADSDAVAEPGMVLAFETPFYGRGIGSLTIEDQLLVTPVGIEVMNTVSRALVQID